MDVGRTDRIVDHERWVLDAWPPGSPVRESRDGLADKALSADETAQLAELDVILLEAATSGEVLDELLEDDSAQPLERWWWHLGAIRAGTFPPEHLPAPLRAVMQPAA